MVRLEPLLILSLQTPSTIVVVVFEHPSASALSSLWAAEFHHDFARSTLSNSMTMTRCGVQSPLYDLRRAATHQEPAAVSLYDRRRPIAKLGEGRLVGYLHVYQRVSSHYSSSHQPRLVV